MSFKNAIIRGVNVANAVYQKQPDGVAKGDPKYIISRSDLVDILACPIKWLKAKGDGSTAMTYGNLLDCMILTPEKFDELFIVAPETYPAADGTDKPWTGQAKYCKQWKADVEADGQTVIKADDYASAVEATHALANDNDIADILANSDKQVMVVAEYHDADTGLVVPIRVLTDVVPTASHPRWGKCLSDLKTASCAAQHVWEGEVFKYGYDMQASLNLDLHTLANPKEERIEFRHLIQESSEPFISARRLLSEEYIQLGRARVNSALRFYCKCLHFNVWPDFETGRNAHNGWSITEPRPWMQEAAFEPEYEWPKERQAIDLDDQGIIP